MAKRRLIVSVMTAGLLMAGCSPQARVGQADAELSRLIGSRSERTLGYVPTIAPAATLPSSPGRQAISRVPQTRVPDAMAQVPVRPVSVVRFSRLGPALPPKPQPGATDTGDSPVAQPLPVDTSFVLGPPVPRTTRVFDLFQCIAYAREHSRDYQSRSEDVFLAGLDVTLQRHLLSPRPYARTRLGFEGGQGVVDYTHAARVTNTVGVRQKLAQGAEVTAEATADFINTLHSNVASQEDANLALSATIPLLQGAGLVNVESLLQGERQLVYQLRTFEDFRRSFAVDIASRYLRLLASRQNVVNRRKNLAKLADLVDRSVELYAASRLSYLEVLRSRQAYWAAEIQVLDAEESYSRSMDDFKILLGMPIRDSLDLVSLRLTLPEVPAVPAQSLEVARRLRLDMQTLRDRVEDARRGVDIAKNGLAAGLDIDASISTGNNSESPASALNGDTAQYKAGITLDLPIDRLSERNSLRRAMVLFYRAQRAVDQQGERAMADVMASLRSIRTTRESLDIQVRNIELAEKRYDFASDLFLLGRVNARDLVEATTALLDAQDRYEQNHAQLLIRVLEYLRDTGQLRVDPSAGELGLVMNPSATPVRSSTQRP